MFPAWAVFGLFYYSSHNLCVAGTMPVQQNFYCVNHHVSQVGFLKTQHRYEIVFTLPEVPELGKDVCPAPIPNPHLRITRLTPTADGEPDGHKHFCFNSSKHVWSKCGCCVTGGLRVTCEYMAHQEGVMCEELQILSESKEDVCVKVKVHARVMGKYDVREML